MRRERSSRKNGPASPRCSVDPAALLEQERHPMTVRLSPQAALYGDERPLPALPACVHYAGSERFIAKALELQAARGPVFDVAGDCEDGAPIGGEAAHAHM